jgi:hypothetical protein
MQAYISSSPTRLVDYNKNILSDVSNDAFYGLICAIVFLVLYSSIWARHYYKKYKKEKLKSKRLAELNGKVRGVLNPACPE